MPFIEIVYLEQRETLNIDASFLNNLRTVDPYSAF